MTFTKASPRLPTSFLFTSSDAVQRGVRRMKTLDSKAHLSRRVQFCPRVLNFLPPSVAPLSPRCTRAPPLDGSLPEEGQVRWLGCIWEDMVSTLKGVNLVLLCTHDDRQDAWRTTRPGGANPDHPLVQLSNLEDCPPTAVSHSSC